ncbi:MAG: AAA family ATPase [Candidatus Njordarchaeota archaeon]
MLRVASRGMQRELCVRNFKSIEFLRVRLNRINIFIGEPATGKSNILECIGLLSFLYLNSIDVPLPLNYFVRLRDLADMFFVRDTTRSISIELVTPAKHLAVQINRGDGDYYLLVNDKKIRIRRNYRGFFVLEEKPEFNFVPIYYYNFSMHGIPSKKILEKANVLLPPSGINLLHVIGEHGELREIISDFLRDRGLELLLKMGTGELVIQGRTNNIVFEVPLWLVSDSLLRLFVVLTIKRIYSQAIFGLEEPESKSYPYYTKILAEQIAFDRKNTYLISTHNPYLLHSLLEKTRQDEIGVFLTRIKSSRTIVQELKEEHIRKIIEGEIDPFISIEDLLDEA